MFSIDLAFSHAQQPFSMGGCCGSDAEVLVLDREFLARSGFLSAASGNTLAALVIDWFWIEIGDSGCAGPCAERVARVFRGLQQRRSIQAVGYRGLRDGGTS